MSTRDQFIATAQRLFAAKGFYGVSIAAIAQQMGLTKQALLHHFGSKEKLYGEVLQRISGELMACTDEIIASRVDPLERLTELVLAQYRLQMADQDAARLIMRELLDNEPRAGAAANWYLKPYLETLVDTLLSINSARERSRGQALAAIYQFLGAAHYFAVSQPTLGRMFGDALYNEARQHYEEELRQMIESRLTIAAR
ncbi:TetR/AcrR family transcriptional regulator [Parahaliea mediterranea]|uniref:TetR/AcrR family transcriptional regulator n=1 Tax=Parahaliea mediterranea TaxID=651086 RepID=A0A939ILQ4_9GAMM|nr:TetR/AcrR family transcriptional regulator [Parahaliea mediterranea]MBN7798631.1 TetR/AcrR family transcriptional regulator [Parahaliea mediterranea]